MGSTDGGRTYHAAAEGGCFAALNGILIESFFLSFFIQLFSSPVFFIFSYFIFI
jgi:hypothetical protein